MNLWTWKTWQDQSYLTCDLLSPSHGFFTRHTHPKTPEDLVKALSPCAQVYRVKQVHGPHVLSPTQIERAIAAGLPTLEDGSTAPLPLADGVISEQTNQSVWTCSADCTPALISDEVTGQVAAVHAGWRGTAQRVLPEAISRFLASGSEKKNLRIAIGPAIDGSVYQVGKDVAVAVGRSVVPDSMHAQENALLAYLMSHEKSPLLPDKHPERVRLDVRRINQMQLAQMGLDEEQIAIAPHCTYQEPETFFSYRRTKEKKVQWSGIVSR